MKALRYPLAPIEALLFARYGRRYEFTVTVRRRNTVEQRVVPATDDDGRWTLMALGRLLAPPPQFRGDEPRTIHHDVIRRWRETGLRDAEADEVACRLGFHPLNVWPDYGQVEMTQRRPTPSPQRALFAAHKYERRERCAGQARPHATGASESHQVEQRSLFASAGGASDEQ